MPIDKKMFLNNFSKQVLDSRISLFLGAGGSCDAGYPTWSKLFSPFANQLNVDIDNCSDYYRLAQYYSNKFGCAELKKCIRDRINKNNHKSKLIDEIVNIGFSNLWTTNFDKVLEMNYTHHDILTNTVFEDSHLSNVDLNKRVNIFKMNGDISHIDKIIATQDDFERYSDSHKLMITFLKRELISNTFLFIGYSFKDNLVLKCLSEIRNYLGDSCNYHYAIIKKDQSDELFEYFIEDLEKRYHIKVLLVDEHSDVVTVLKELNHKIRKRRVFISGSFTSSEMNLENYSHQISKHLTSQLLENEFRIVNGIGSRFGTHLIGYANEFLAKKGVKHIDRHLIIKPFVSNHIDAVQLKKTSREHMINQCGSAIFIFGENSGNDSNVKSGVMEEFEIAVSQNKVVIPISYPNMISHEIWLGVKDNITKFFYLEKVISKLTSNEDPEAVSKLIIQIIESIQDL